MYDVLECGERETDLGTILYVRIHRGDMAPMSWRELWDLLDDLYPGRWGIQSFPARGYMLDQANKYHVMLLPQGVIPKGLDIGDKP